VLVAMPDYPGTVNDLPGPRDMQGLMQEVLVQKYGFPEENLVLLNDAQATHDAIVAAIEKQLIAKAQPGDVAVFWYGGHGSKVPDRDGDEDDGQDECLCPVDAESKPLLDDELYQLFGRVRTENLTVILDCCRSGTGTKEFTEPTVFPLYMRLPGSGASRVETASPSGMGGREINHLLLASCRADQLGVAGTLDTGEEILVFTAALGLTLQEASPQATYREVLDAVRQRIRQWQIIGPDQPDVQEPQLEGPRPDRAVFASAAAPPPPAPRVPFGLVQRVDGQRILVDVGPWQESTSGPCWACTGRPRSGLRANRWPPRRLQATAELLQGEVRVGMRAIVIGQAFPSEPLRLRLTLPTKDWDVTAKPDREALLREVAAALRPVAYVRVIGEKESPDRMVTVSRQDRRWTLRLYSPPGGLLGEGQGDAAMAAVTALRPLLAREWMIERCAGLQNPCPPFRLTVRDPKGANPTYWLGEEMTLHVQAEQACQVVLLNVGATGRLTLLLPNRFRPEWALRAGEKVTLPDPAMGFAFTANRPAG